jgi:SAM-dependent methyltransferase
MMFRQFSPLAHVLAFLVLVTLPLRGAGEAETTSRYEYREQHSRDGIGKFYMGREIAIVMGHQAADWLERPERAEEEHTEKLVEALELRPGIAVADAGAGTGYFTERIAKRVTPGGKVFATDIQPEMLAILTNKMEELQITNVVPILGSATNSGLASASVDLALMVDVYHEFSHPFEMAQQLCAALKPGGQLVFVEFRGEDPSVPIKPLHKMTEAQVRREMSVQNLRWSKTLTNLPRQHIIVFEKRSN